MCLRAFQRFDGKRLEELGLSELDMISDLTPGLVIQEQSPNNPGFVIRGLRPIAARHKFLRVFRFTTTVSMCRVHVALILSYLILSV